MYMPKLNTEESVLSWLNNCSLVELRNYFKLAEDNATLVSFVHKLENGNTYYINLRKEKDTLFPVPINTDFGFEKLLGSHNYPELIPIAQKLVKAFKLEQQSYWKTLWKQYERNYQTNYSEEN